jgi:hypothetical protein
VTWLTIAEVKIFLIDIVEKAFNTVSTGYTKEDAEEFLKGQGGFDAIHIS